MLEIYRSMCFLLSSCVVREFSFSISLLMNLIPDRLQICNVTLLSIAFQYRPTPYCHSLKRDTSVVSSGLHTYPLT